MSESLGADEVFCRDCGAAIDERAEICPECGIRQKEPKPSPGEGKDPGLAAAAAFFVPGLGQIYNGQIAKGLVILVVFVISAITIIGLLLAIPLWIWGIYDAYKVAESGGEPSTGGSAAAPRTSTRHALTWAIEEGDDADRAETIRDRLMSTKLHEFPEEDREFIAETVAAYDQEHGSGHLEAVEPALRG